MNQLLWDKTLSWNAWFRDQVTLPRLQRAGYAVVGLTVGGGNGGRPAAMASLKAVAALVERQPDEFLVLREVDDLAPTSRRGRLALELNFQGTEPLEGRLDAVAEFHRAGVRQMGLVWNADNEAGCSASSSTDTGLTRFGRQLVQEMNRVGVVVDGTHAGYRTTLEAMDACAAPFVFSHSNVDAIEPSYKNLKDEQILRCAQTGGVIGISGFGTYLDELEASAQAMLRQIDHVCELVGPEHVGLGLDFVANPQPLWEKVRLNPQLWPGVRECRFFPPEEVAVLADLMRGAGYPENDVANILGGNWQRVAAKAWQGNNAVNHDHS